VFEIISNPDIPVDEERLTAGGSIHRDLRGPEPVIIWDNLLELQLGPLYNLNPPMVRGVFVYKYRFCMDGGRSLAVKHRTSVKTRSVPLDTDGANDEDGQDDADRNDHHQYH